MDRIAALLLTLATAGFVGSVTWFGASPHLVETAGAQGAGRVMEPALAAGLPMGLVGTIVTEPSPLPVLALRLIQNGEAIPWLLTVVVCLLLAGHVIRHLLTRWGGDRGPDRDPGGPWTPGRFAMGGRDGRLAEQAPLILALLAASVWPWAAIEHPTAGFLAAALAMVGALAAVIRGQRDGARIRHSVAVGLFAGWMTAIAMASFVGVLILQGGVPATLAALAGMWLCGMIGTWVQWRLGRPIAYAMGLIWALVGVAIITMEHDPLVAMAAILAIAALAVTVVRSAS